MAHDSAKLKPFKNAERNDNRPKGIKHFLGWLYLRIFGWRLEGAPPKAAKFVIIAAPHTSNWDLSFMLACIYIYGVKLSWMGKHTSFRWPFGIFLRWLGGIPINRSSRHNVVEQMVQAFKEHDALVIAVPPEGTRHRVKSWKTGFYYIALGAGVPIATGFLDFKRKCGGFGPTLNPSGDIKADMDILRKFYQNITAKFPEDFGPIVASSPVDDGPCPSSYSTNMLSK